MTVFLLMMSVEYESDTVYGVYSTKEKALEGLEIWILRYFNGATKEDIVRHVYEVPGGEQEYWKIKGRASDHSWIITEEKVDCNDIGQ